ncbi:MAG TPA: hypothetical protein VGR28_14130 [Candidatus Thermoplasmatota archaeon]|nr:hypothetical protein [Candidatus Thermoplasmatota archaeon]
MFGDPKIVAALAVAIIATPPVVNALLAKALEQADTDWLRDIDFTPPDDAQPPDNLRGDVQQGDGRGRLPNTPPPSVPHPPPCRPEPREGSSRTVAGPVAVDPQGAIRLTTEPGDLAVVFRIDGTDVTGQPTFSVRDESPQWQSPSQLYTREHVQFGEDESWLNPEPGAVWTLTWDLTGTSFTGFAFVLTAMVCPGGP